MTPLAHKLANELTLLRADRTSFWRCADLNRKTLSQLLDGTHFFEVTDVLPLIEELVGVSVEAVSDRFFLPAPKTWLELENSCGRFAIMLEDVGEKRARVSVVFRNFCQEIGVLSLTSDDYYFRGGEMAIPNEFAELGARFYELIFPLVHGMLVLINTPKLIGRRQHMPHRGLERKLNRCLGVGRFPLHAWTELRLVVTPTYIDDSGVIHEAHFTGRKCLHFCRAHLRIRNGKLEVVSAHWRGDPALGFKRTRYKVVPPQRRAA